MWNRVVAIAFASAATLPAFAQACPSLDRTLTGGRPTDIVARGPFAYLSTFNGVEAWDLSDLGAPLLTAQLPSVGAVQLAIDNDRLYVLTRFGESTLEIWSLTDPANPALLSITIVGPSINLPPDDFAVSDDTALIAIGNGDVRAIDIGDPTAPKIVGDIEGPNSYSRFEAVVFVGESAVVMDMYWRSLSVVDLSDPAFPVLGPALSLPLVIPIRPVAIGAHVFAIAQSELLAIHVGPEGALELVGSSPIPFGPHDLTIDQLSGHLLVASWDGQIATYSVVDPQRPALLSVCCASASNEHTRIAAGDGFLAAADDRQLRILDIADPLAPSQTHSGTRLVRVGGVAASSERAFVAGGSRTHTLSLEAGTPIDDYSTLLLCPEGATGILPRAVAVRDRLAVVASGLGLGRLFAIDLSDAAAPVVMGFEDPQIGVARIIEVQGDIGYFAMRTPQGDYGRLQSRDLSNPSRGMPLLDDLSVPPGIIDLATHGTVVYALRADDTLAVIDASEPSDLSIGAIISDLTVEGSGSDVHSITVSNGFAFVLDSDGRITKLDLANPLLPQPVGAGNIVVPPLFVSYFQRLLVSGDTGYVMARGGYYWRSWVMALDLSDPNAPQEIARRALPTESLSLTMALTPTGVLVGADGLLHFSFVSCPCPADLDGDGYVGMADLMLVLDAFNTVPSDPNYNPAADTNLDKVIDFADLNVILASFNQPC